MLKKLLIYKQTLIGIFKAKTQAILLILLTTILSISITIGMTSIANLKQSKEFMGSNVTYDYYHQGEPLREFNYHELKVHDFDFSLYSKPDNLIQLNMDNVNLNIDSHNKIQSFTLKNFLNDKQINKESSGFKNSLIGRLLIEKYNNNFDNDEFQNYYQNYLSALKNYIEPLASELLTKYYQQVYKSDLTYQQYINIKNPNQTNIFKYDLLKQWLNQEKDKDVSLEQTGYINELQILRQLQNEIAGILTDFQVTVRNEFTMTDFSNDLNYRFIKINNFKSSLKVVQGVLPYTVNQVIINPQFAKLKNYKIGDKIKIMNLNLTITGFGGDNWTVLPITNELNPLPNYNNDVIVFLNDNLFLDIQLKSRENIFDISAVYLKHHGLSSSLEGNLAWYQILVNNFLAFKEPLNINKTEHIKKYDPNYFINRGFNSFDTFFSVYKTIAISTIVFTAIISFLIIALMIKKTIEKKYSQIALLQALGYSKGQIITSYWVYILIIGFIAVPIGWIIGTFCQMIITNIFSNIFILPNNLFLLDFGSFFLQIFSLSLITIICSTLVLYKFLSLSLPNLFNYQTNYNKKSKFITKIYYRFFQFGSFQTRFKIILATVSYKKLLLMTLTIFIATFTITISLLIPINIIKLNESYYRGINYQTNVEFHQGITNIPFNRYNFFKSSGIEYSSNEPLYPITENAITTSYMKKNDGQWIDITTGTSLKNLPVEDIIDQISYNIFNFSGKAMSLGWLELMEKQYKDTAAIKLISNIVCPLFNNIQDKKITMNPNQNWRDCVKNVIVNSLPSFVKKHLLNDEYKNRFFLGFNVLPYNDKEDEMLTYYSSNLTNNYEVKTHGINIDSKIIDLATETRKKLAISKTINNTTTIPIVINKSLQIKKKLYVNDIIDFTNQIKVLKYKTNDKQWKSIPPDWWGYQNGDEINNFKEDIWKMPNDKFTMANKTISYGANNSYGYRQTNDLDKQILDGNKMTYRNYNNVILRLPTAELDPSSLKNLRSLPNIPTGHDNKYVVEDKEEFIIVRPYSIIWNDEKKRNINEDDIANSINLITNGKNLQTFLSRAYKNNKHFGIDYFSETNNTNHKYQYQVIDIHNSYNNPIIFTNQKFANQIIGVPVGNDFNKPIYDLKLNDLYSNHPFKNVSIWSNGRYSKNAELLDVTTGHSTFSSNNLYNMSDGEFYTNVVNNFDLLSIKQNFIQKIASIASSIVALFLINSITIAMIIISMISNFSLNHFARMIALLKLQGYRDFTINNLLLTMFIPTLIIGFIIGTVLAISAATGLIYILQNLFLLIIPFKLVWWIIVVSFAIIVCIYSLTYLIFTLYLKRINLLELLKTND